MKRQSFDLFKAIICLCLSGMAFPSNGTAGEGRVEILTSTFPIRQITQNVIQGRANVHVDLMIPAQLGCPHDYLLTPQDMQKLSKANVLIVNGLGMEEFLGTPVEQTGSKITIVDSSEGIKDILQYSEMKEHQPVHHETKQESEHAEKTGHVHKDENHRHAGVNPHLFASPRMAALLAVTIAEALSRIDPGGEGVYIANSRAYAEKMNRLAGEFTALGKRLRNNRVVAQHGIFDYLARDMGLEIVAVVQSHAGQEPSAAEMLKIIKAIKHEKAGAIFTEPQYQAKIGRTIAKEAGIAEAALDPVATGPENAPLDYYETVMRRNLKTLERILGTK